MKERASMSETVDYGIELCHHADRRIALDLDDGVKLDCSKFGSLLAKVATAHSEKTARP